MSPTMFSWQAATSGKTEASRSSLRMRWICGGTFLPPWKRSSASARFASQRQRVAKIGDASAACSRISCTVSVCRIVEDVAQREAVLLGQRDVQAVVGGGGLQLKIERAAETLAQRQSPGLVDAPAERRMDDELHAAAFIEEALGDDRLLRGHLAQHRAAGDDVLDQLLGAGVIEPAFVFQPRDRVLHLGWIRSAQSGLRLRSSSRVRLGSRHRQRRRVRQQRADAARANRPHAATARRCAPELRRARKESFGGAPWASSTSTRPDLDSTR